MYECVCIHVRDPETLYVKTDTLYRYFQKRDLQVTRKVFDGINPFFLYQGGKGRGLRSFQWYQLPCRLFGREPSSPEFKERSFCDPLRSP